MHLERSKVVASSWMAVRNALVILRCDQENSLLEINANFENEKCLHMSSYILVK